jgi:DNA-binding transcriptional MocR family regulator
MPRPPYVTLPVRADALGRRPTARHIVDVIAAEIQSGRLPPGLRLPPVRVLEHQLGISKNTVQAAYDELAARGLIDARAREGVFVAAQEPAPAEPLPPLGAAAPPLRLLRPARPARRAGDRIPMSMVFIDPDLLPIPQIADCFRSVLSSPGLPALYDAQGYPPLREAIAERLRARGMDVGADDVILTTGSQQGLDIVAKALEGRRVAVEDPVYGNARMLFAGLGIELVGLRLDPFAPVPLDEWAAAIAARRPALLYAISSYQNPTGYSYSTYELIQILEMSQHFGFAILEDDWGSDMLSGTEYRPTLRALGGPNVLYLNSFTKKLLPSLRLGFLAGSPETRDALVAAKQLTTLGNVAVTEAVLFEFLDRGYYDTHLRRLHEALDARYHACLDALRELMPEGVRWSTPGGGPTLWLELPRAVDLGRLRERLSAWGVDIEDAGDHFHGTPHLHGFRLGYAFLPQAILRKGIERLAEALENLLR